MSHPLQASAAADSLGAQPFGVTDAAMIDVCAQLMVRASRKQHCGWTRQVATQRLATLLSASGVQGYLCRDELGAPLSFVIGRAANQQFAVYEMCANESHRHARACMALLQHVRAAAQVRDVIFDMAHGRRHVRQLVRAL